MFGPQPAPQPTQRLTWQEYIDRIKNGPAPSYTPPANAQQPQGPGTAAGWDSSGNARGGALGGILGMKNGSPVVSRIPATPVDYDRMHSILNSGVLTGGHAQTAADIAAAAPPAPTPAPAPQPAPAQPQNPLQAFITQLFNSVPKPQAAGK